MITGLLNGVHVLSDKHAADEIQNAACKDGLLVWRIALTGITTKTELLDAIGKGLTLPDYYRLNWDSLEECLRDFDDGNGWLIIFDDADKLLSLPRRDVSTFGAILSDVNRYWIAEGRRFGAVFVGSPSLSEALAFARAS